MYRDAFLIFLLVIAVIYDLRERRIPNLLIIFGLFFALSYYFFTGGTAALIYCVKGFLAGIALLFIPFAMNGIGAGDVKLLGVIGAIKGTAFAISSFLWMAIWGGAIALIILIRRKNLKATIKKMSQGLVLASMGGIPLNETLSKDELSSYYPYAVAIGLGVACSFIKGWY